MKHHSINYLFFFMLFFLGCASANHLDSQVQGTFLSKENSSLKLVINRKSFVLLNVSKGGDLAALCCDTVTFGDVSYNTKGFLTLNSDPGLNPIFINMKVAESKNNKKDSVYFHIVNPIETAYRKFNASGSELTYTLLVQPKSRSLDYFKENNQPFDENTIRYFNPDKLGIANLTVMVVPKQTIPVRELAVRELHTMQYDVKSAESNVFEITLPELSYGFISYKRLNNDYVKIVDQNTLEWDGKRFVRTN